MGKTGVPNSLPFRPYCDLCFKYDPAWYEGEWKGHGGMKLDICIGCKKRQDDRLANQ